MNSISYFDSIAEKWNVIRSEYFEEKLKYILLSKADIKDKICADLGCGTGFVSLALSPDAIIVFSIDLSKNMLKALSTAAKNMAIKNIYPIKGFMDDIPLFDESVDVVFTNMALHHVVNAPYAVKEMSRILKKGGTLIISDVEEHNGAWARAEMHDVWLGFSHRQIREWMAEAGLCNIEINNSDLKCKGRSSKGEYTETGIFIAKGIKRAAI